MGSVWTWVICMALAVGISLVAAHVYFLATCEKPLVTTYEYRFVGKTWLYGPVQRCPK